MSFISVPLVVGIICAGIYGLFELFVRKKERLHFLWEVGIAQLYGYSFLV